MYDRYLRFDVMHMNTLCVEVEIDRVEKKLNLVDHTTIRYYNPFRMPDPKIEHVIKYISNRCFPETRANKDELLELLGLEYYDPIDITRITRGLMMDDHFWIRYEGDEATYEDIRIRPE